MITISINQFGTLTCAAGLNYGASVKHLQFNGHLLFIVNRCLKHFYCLRNLKKRTQWSEGFSRWLKKCILFLALASAQCQWGNDQCPLNSSFVVTLNLRDNTFNGWTDSISCLKIITQAKCCLCVIGSTPMQKPHSSHTCTYSLSPPFFPSSSPSLTWLEMRWCRSSPCLFKKMIDSWLKGVSGWCSSEY